ncbi:uncharacterized protein [Atheta coriaria]|uniref:uncharacterized protein isoform X2 n=1 Tax=Dalotia coriaria TaxID=877792 RepID=UPI0031F45847
MHPSESKDTRDARGKRVKDSEPARARPVRDVFSMPNTPKKLTTRARDLFDPPGSSSNSKLSLVGTNLKRFASNTSISGSQTLKTLPEIMTLQDFSSSSTSTIGNQTNTEAKPESTIRIKAKGLLERRGSNASLTIDLGSSLSTSTTPEKTIECKPTLSHSHLTQGPRLNSAKSISTLNLTSFGTCFTSFYQNVYKCEHCVKKTAHAAHPATPVPVSIEKDKEKERKNDTCGNCTIYESIPSKFCMKETCHTPKKKCNCICNIMGGGRRSLSNENLYVPPCSLCLTGNGHHVSRHCRGHRRACYPRQADLESQSLSDDFKLHLQNVQYLQTAGSVLSIAELRACCELPRVPKLHQEFWEVPLNLQEKCIVSGSQTRNRYKGVLPNEHSRVQLTSPQPYIHANYIKGPDYTETAYVATQGPMAHTCDDFWHMVWQTQCDCIVMLTQLVEKGRNKCELYFPLGKSRTEVSTPMSSESSSTVTTQETVIMRSCSTSGTPTSAAGNTLSRTTSSSSSSSTSSSSGASSLSAYSSSTSSCSTSTSGAHDASGKVSYFTIRTAPSTQPDKFTFGYAPASTPTNNNHQFRCTSTNTRRMNSEQEEVVRYEELDEVQHGNYHIHFVSLQMLGDISVRILRVVNLETQECRLVRHYWYANWQDHKMADPAQVLRLAVNILQYLDFKEDTVNANSNDDLDEGKTALVVHCSAGIGRTGCFLAILNGIQQLRTNANVDVLAILCSLRLHRGGMVQTAEQYELIHRVLGMYAEQIIKH